MVGSLAVVVVAALVGFSLTGNSTSPTPSTTTTAQTTSTTP